MKKRSIVIATIHSWNINQYRKWTPPMGFTKHLIISKEQLTYEKLSKLNPEYIFFPHWSWIIPKDIYENFECIVFHMTDLPFGRGGSPLQNLIIRGIYNTKISAIRVVAGMDAGPIYKKRSFNIRTGSAEEMYKRLSKDIFEMMTEITHRRPKPKKQRGSVVLFKRRKPDESRIPPGLAGRKLYDFIRMLDAEGYPVAFIEEGGRRFEFRNANIENDLVISEVAIKK